MHTSGLVLWALCLLLCNYSLHIVIAYSYEDNDFAEFEDFDSGDDVEEIKPTDATNLPKDTGPPLSSDNTQHTQAMNMEKRKGKTAADSKHGMPLSDDDEDGIIEDEDEFFKDEEEFEGFEDLESEEVPEKKSAEPQLTVAKIPMHFRTHWDSYWLEKVMVAGLLIYFVNFFTGKGKNVKIAHMWLDNFTSFLDKNSLFLGINGKFKVDEEGLIKESESLYTMRCTGSTSCIGKSMLIELRLIKRQDLMSLMVGLVRPQQDQLHIKINLKCNFMETFVMCVGTKKTITKFFKEYSDLSKYCTLVTKPETKYNVPVGFSILSEQAECTSAILENRVTSILVKYQQLIEYIHISDQFCGTVQQDDSNVWNHYNCRPVIMVGLNLPKNSDLETIQPILMLILYLMERLKFFRLSRESKRKADKNRLRVEKLFFKNAHAASAEAAAKRREKKRIQEKERVMAEDNPEKQRRWELKEQKRQAKKKAPKMKRVSIKSL